MSSREPLDLIPQGLLDLFELRFGFITTAQVVEAFERPVAKSLSRQPARTLRQQNHADNEDDGGKTAVMNIHRQSLRAAREKSTKYAIPMPHGDGQLIERDQRAPNSRGRHFREIQRRDQRGQHRYTRHWKGSEIERQSAEH